MVLASVAFEVFGRVQGVFFRKYAVAEAHRLKLFGWIRNTESDTVQGVAQGKKEAVDEFKTWLSTKGSPRSQIERAEFSDERELSKLEYSSFQVRR
ncbi:Acylphosphatase-like domain-containing protein [Hyaloraphidium curvatum]|nr:Acylphosphatase-like domain-containing protein [Hyaloraphidium curvatum]